MDTLNDILDASKSGNLDPTEAHNRVLNLFIPKETIVILIGDYERRIETINEMLQNDKLPVITRERLETKQSCYRTFIIELKEELRYI